jgi:hypothetical protein
LRLDPKRSIETLKRNGGKVRKTARELGISPLPSPALLHFA